MYIYFFILAVADAEDGGIILPDAGTSEFRSSHLVHIDGLQRLVEAEDDGRVLVLRFALAKHHSSLALRVYRQPNPVDRHMIRIVKGRVEW